MPTMKLGTDTANVMSYVMGSSRQPAPVVGMGATILCWTDRIAGTIIKVTAYTFTVQEDRAIRTDKNGMSEAQDYRYERDRHGRTHVFRRTKKGWRSQGRGVLIGDRRHYHDFSF